MNHVQIFKNDQFGEIRTVEQNGEILFVAADVCKALNIDRTQTRRLDDDEKGVCLIHTPGGNQEITTVNEYGLYNLVLSSRKPEAKAFKRWITHDVIPAIRKTGSYSKQLSPLEILAAQSQALVEQERRTTALEQDLQSMRDVLSLRPNNWREETGKLFIKMSYKMNNDLSALEALRTESYNLLDERMKVNLQVRLTNKRRRMAEEGISSSRRGKINYLDVIAEDSKLIEGYTAIVKEMAVKYGIAGGVEK